MPEWNMLVKLKGNKLWAISIFKEIDKAMHESKFILPALYDGEVLNWLCELQKKACGRN